MFKVRPRRSIRIRNRKDKPKDVSKKTPAKRKLVHTCPGGEPIDIGPPKKKRKLKHISLSFSLDPNMPYHLAGGGTHWAIPRNLQHPIRFEVTTTPNNNLAEWAQVQWSLNGVNFAPGGNGHTYDHPGNATGRFRVRVTRLGESAEITLWIFWANVLIQTAGFLPVGCNIDFTYPANPALGANPNVLGPRTIVLNNGLPYGVGRICASATFQPANLHTVLHTNLRFRRRIDEERYWPDGLLNVSVNQNDNSVDPHYMQYAPNVNEEIFDLDFFAFANFDHADFFTEARINFTQWVAFRGHRCSNDAQWHLIGELLAYPPGILVDNIPPNPVQQMPTPNHALNPTIVRLEVGGGHAALQPASRYEKTGPDGHEIILNHGRT